VSRRAWPSDLGRNALLSFFSLSLAFMLFSWLTGPDPALEVIDETSELAAEMIPLRTVPIDVFLPVSSDSMYRWILGPGFDSPEADGAWTKATRASIITYPIEASGVKSIELSVAAVSSGDSAAKEVEFTTTAGSTLVDVAVEGQRVVLPVAEAAEQFVHIECDDLASPVTPSGVVDKRSLCVKVFAVALRSGEAG